MQIVLIAPRHYQTEDMTYEPLRKAVSPPLSLLTVAGLTPEKHEVRLLDEGLEEVPEDLEADLVGITATTAAAPRAYEIADRLRARGIPVVLGGIHPSALPEEALEHADAVVVGEAEGQWEQLLADFEAGEMKPVYRREGWGDLESVPSPRYDLVDPRRYFLPNAAQTTRGCPFDCDYCSVTTFFGRTYRTRRIEDVRADVEKMPPGPIVFVDDNIMGKPSYSKKLFAALRELGRMWGSQASVTMLKTPELIAEAARSGCKILFVGLETLSQTNLAAVGKGFNVVGMYRELVRRLHDHGISIIASFMFGLDDDDPDVFDRTLEFVLANKIDSCMFSILTPLPGTRLFDRLHREGRILDTDWRHYDGAHVTFRPANMTPEQLLEGYHRAYAQLYSMGSILRRAMGRMGFTRSYWLLNIIWRKYVTNWLRGLGTHPGVPAAAPVNK